MNGTAASADSISRATEVVAGVAAPDLTQEPQKALPITEFPLRPIAEKKQRLEMLDAARAIAIAGVVWLHACATPELQAFGSLGTFGVPFYVFVALYFLTRSFRQNPDRLIQEYIIGRFLRLYVPFLAWTLIYLVARDFKQVFIAGRTMVPPHYAMLWVGSAYHLWFLPFLLFVCAASVLVVKLCVLKPNWSWTIVFSLAAIGCTLSFVPRPEWLNYASMTAVGDPNADVFQGYFFYQSWRALPSVFCGIAIAWSLCAEGMNASALPVIGATGFFLTAATVGEQLVNGYSRLDRTLSGLGWFLAALTPWQSRVTVFLGNIGRHSYGIYLCHVLFIEGIQVGLAKFAAQHAVAADLVTFALSLVLSTALTLLLVRSKWTAWLTGMG